MKNLFRFIVFAALISFPMHIFVSCQDLPQSPERNNPLDAYNPGTGGDPFSLQAVIGGGGIRLTWGMPDVSGILGYSVYRQEDEQGSFSQRDQVEATIASYVDTNVENGHTYRYYVLARGESGESSSTNVATVRINVDPEVSIADSAEYTAMRDVEVTVIATTGDSMRISNYADLHDASWQAYQSLLIHQLRDSAGTKTVYVQGHYTDAALSPIVSDDILPLPMNSSMVINSNIATTPSRLVRLDLQAAGALQMRISNEPFEPPVLNRVGRERIGITHMLKSKSNWESDFDHHRLDESQTEWIPFDSVYTDWELLTGYDTKTVYVEFKNDFGIVESDFDDIDPLPLTPFVEIAEGAATTATRYVDLALSADGATEMRLWNGGGEDTTEWQPYVTTIEDWELETGSGTKTVYVQFRNDFLIEAEASDDIDPAQLTPVLEILPDSQFINHPDITLSMPGVGALEMLVGENPDSTGGMWQLYVETLPYVLSDGDDWKRVYAWYRHEFFSAGPALDTVGLDTHVEVDTFHWWSALDDTVFLYGDTLGLHLRMQPDLFESDSIEHNGTALVMIPGLFSNITLVDNGDGIYTEWHVLTSGNDVSDATVSLAFCDRAGNETSTVASTPISYFRHPFEVGYYDTPGYAMGVAASGSYIYVADGSGGLRVVNIMNPASPHEEGYYDTPGSAYDVAVSGSYAYVADYDRGLRVVNITNPGSPYEDGFCDTPGSARGVAVSGYYAYVADGYNGLRVVNIINPTSPTEVGSYDTPGYAYDVAISGNYAYVADHTSGLRVVDISNPVSPWEAGYYATPGDALGVAVLGNYAYVANGGSGLRVVNITNPVAPYEVGFYDTPGYARGVAVLGYYAYVADWESDLRVVRVPR